MPTLPRVPPDARPPYGPEGTPKTFTDVSHRIRHATERQDHDSGPRTNLPAMDPTGPLLKLAGAAVLGYLLGTIIHRRASDTFELPRPRPRRRMEPVATHRARPDERASSVRFR